MVPLEPLVPLETSRELNVTVRLNTEGVRGGHTKLKPWKYRKYWKYWKYPGNQLVTYS